MADMEIVLCPCSYKYLGKHCNLRNGGEPDRKDLDRHGCEEVDMICSKRQLLGNLKINVNPADQC